MNDMPFQLQNPKVSHASGRLLTDPDFSRVWNASGVRPSATGAMEGNVCIVRCSATEVRISLDMIPINRIQPAAALHGRYYGGRRIRAVRPGGRSAHEEEDRVRG